MKQNFIIAETIDAVLIIIITAFSLGLAVGAAVAGFKLAIFLLDWIIK